MSGARPGRDGAPPDLADRLLAVRDTLVAALTQVDGMLREVGRAREATRAQAADAAAREWDTFDGDGVGGAAGAGGAGMDGRAGAGDFDTEERTNGEPEGSRTRRRRARS